MPPLLILFFVVTLLYYVSQHLRLKLKLGGIPGPTGIPFVGNAHQLIKGGPEGLLRNIGEFRKEFGTRIQLWLGLTPYVLIANPGDIEKVLSSQQHIEKSPDYDFLLPWLGRGLLTSTGSLWHSRRKLLTPAFHFSILEDFLTIMCEQGDILTEILDDFRGKGAFDMFPVVTRAALDIICETAMGKKINAQRNADSEYVAAVYRISDIVHARQLRPWLQPQLLWSLSPSGREEGRLLKVLHGFTSSVIRKRKRSRRDGIKRKGKKPAFLDLLLDFQESNPDANLDDKAIREEVDTFMFEGHDTTAANINWTLYLIGRHPEIQAKVHQEIDQVLSGTKGKIPTSELAQLKYLECCIKESLRIFPSVPIFGRRLAGELKLDEDVTLPQETVVLIIPYYAHRDSKIFPEPEEFRPERFQSLEKHPFSYIPFSGGSRNCIGQKFAVMEEKVVLAKVLQKFKITALQPREEVSLLSELILRPKGGLQVKLERRD